MTYKELQFGLNIDHGLVLHDGPLLTLGGLSILSNKLVEVEGTIRAHLGGPEERVRLKDLIDMMRGVAATGETD